MINWTLYKQGIKSNFKLFLIFCAILTLYTVLVIQMFDPQLSSTLETFTEAMPEMMSMFGMNDAATDINSFITNYLYGFLYLLFPLVFYIILTNRLITSHIDKGSMSYLLASPNNRVKIIFTQLKVIGTYIFSLILYVTLVAIITSEIVFPKELDISSFIFLNIGLLFLHLALSSIGFLASCTFSESKNALFLGAGIPVIFFIIQMIVNLGDKFEKLKYLTIFTLFDSKGLINQTESSYIMAFSLFLISIVLYFIGILIFKKRDLSV